MPLLTGQHPFSARKTQHGETAVSPWLCAETHVFSVGNCQSNMQSILTEKSEANGASYLQNHKGPRWSWRKWTECRYRQGVPVSDSVNRYRKQKTAREQRKQRAVWCLLLPSAAGPGSRRSFLKLFLLPLLLLLPVSYVKTPTPTAVVNVNCCGECATSPMEMVTQTASHSYSSHLLIQRRRWQTGFTDVNTQVILAWDKAWYSCKPTQ